MFSDDFYGLFRALPEVRQETWLDTEDFISRVNGLEETRYSKHRDRALRQISRAFPELFAWLHSQRREYGIKDDEFDSFILWPLAGLIKVWGGVKFLPDAELTGFTLEERHRRLSESQWPKELDVAFAALQGDRSSYVGHGLSNLSLEQADRLRKMVVIMMTYLNWLHSSEALALPGFVVISTNAAA